jgi:hypothetical protein
MPFVNLRSAILLFCLGASLAPGQQYQITTIAGGRTPATPLIGVSPVGIYSGSGVTADNQGNVYFSDNNCCVWRMDHNGVVTRVAGQWNQKGYAGDGGPAVGATLNTPGNIAADGAGNLYVFDVGNGVIRRITPDGNIGKLVDAAAWSSSEFVPSVAVDPAGISITRFAILLTTRRADARRRWFIRSLQMARSRRTRAAERERQEMAVLLPV